MANPQPSDWEPRIGGNAIKSLRNANRFLYFAPAAIIVMLIGIFITRQTGPAAVPLFWISILIGFGYCVLVYPIGFYYCMLKGGREAAKYIDLVRYTGQTRVPRPALRSAMDFDNFLVEEGIPAREGYTPTPSPRAYVLAEKIKRGRKKRRTHVAVLSEAATPPGRPAVSACPKAAPTAALRPKT